MAEYTLQHVSLPDLRRLLAEARAALRQATDQLGVARAQAEQRAIDAAGGDKALGPNAESRERALTLALEQDAGYQAALGSLRATQAYVAALEAELEIRLDERRERRIDADLRLADAYTVLAYGGDAPMGRRVAARDHDGEEGRPDA